MGIVIAEGNNELNVQLTPTIDTWLAGQVLDVSALPYRPLAGVTIRGEHAFYPPFSGSTDSEGRFWFEVSFTGTDYQAYPYVVSFTKAGYQEVRRRVYTARGENLLEVLMVPIGIGLPSREEVDFAVEYGRQKLREYGWMPGGYLTGPQWGEVYRYIAPLAQRFTDDWTREFEEWKTTDPDYLAAVALLQELRNDPATLIHGQVPLPPGTCVDYDTGRGDWVIDCYTRAVICHVTEMIPGLTRADYERWGCYFWYAWGAYYCPAWVGTLNAAGQKMSNLATAKQAELKWKIDHRDRMYDEVLIL